MTAYASSAPASAIANNLRARGSGASDGPISAVKIAGFSGSQFDGKVVARRHVFIPFSHTSVAAGYYGDALDFDKGSMFRVIVLDVRGKPVVIYVDKAALPASQFPAFLSGEAATVLHSLKFS
jgi:hypothetical protein